MPLRWFCTANRSFGIAVTASSPAWSSPLSYITASNTDSILSVLFMTAAVVVVVVWSGVKVARWRPYEAARESLFATRTAQRYSSLPRGRREEAGKPAGKQQAGARKQAPRCGRTRVHAQRVAALLGVKVEGVGQVGGVKGGEELVLRLGCGGTGTKRCGRSWQGRLRTRGTAAGRGAVRRAGGLAPATGASRAGSKGTSAGAASAPRAGSPAQRGNAFLAGAARRSSVENHSVSQVLVSHRPWLPHTRSTRQSPH